MRNYINKTFTYDEMNTALCVWEYITDQLLLSEKTNDWDVHRIVDWVDNVGGKLDARHEVITIAKFVASVWDEMDNDTCALCHPYDYEFVPFVTEFWFKDGNGKAQCSVDDVEYLVRKIRENYNRCVHCGDVLLRDATAQWNEHKEEWVISALQDHTWCEQCDH